MCCRWSGAARRHGNLSCPGTDCNDEVVNAMQDLPDDRGRIHTHSRPAARHPPRNLPRLVDADPPSASLAKGLGSSTKTPAREFYVADLQEIFRHICERRGSLQNILVGRPTFGGHDGPASLDLVACDEMVVMCILVVNVSCVSLGPLQVWVPGSLACASLPGLFPSS